jgi:hypothetical protein
MPKNIQESIAKRDQLIHKTNKIMFLIVLNLSNIYIFLCIYKLYILSLAFRQSELNNYSIFLKTQIQ